MVTREVLHKFFTYDADSGVFKNAITRGSGAPAGKKAGSVDKSGYLMIKIGGRSYLAHRLAWLYFYGKWPDQQIDHINGDRCDNRIKNLRDVTAQANRQNVRAAQRNNKLGVLGVSRNGSGFSASIETDGKPLYLGTFKDIESASAVYRAAKLSQHVGAVA